MKISNLVILLFVIVLAVLIYFNYDGGFIVSRETVPEEKINLISKLPKLPVEGKAPALVGIEGWFNTKPLAEKDLRGKVVLVDFWTYSCINCIRTFPHLSAWHEKYKDDGFILLGVHSPEFDFEKKKENVLAAIEQYGIKYPVALDSEHATWNAYDNRYWPAHYLIDANGKLRYRHFGEGRYEETEAAIQQLLLEAGLLTLDAISEIKEPPSGVDFKSIGTPEIYLGYLRLNNLGNPDKGVQPDRPYTFSEPEVIEQNRFYFVGEWSIGPEFAEFTGERGKLVVRYKANKANMVLSVGDGAINTVEVKLDGAHLTEENGGTDVYIKNGESFVDIRSPRLYNFSDTGADYDWHTLEIIITRPGLRAFTYTFG